MIGSFSSFLIILLIANSVFIFLLYGQLQLSYNQIEADITELKEGTQSKFNSLTDNILETKQDITTIETSLESIDIQISSIGEEFDELKASVSSDFSGIFENAVKSVMTIRTDVGQGTGFAITNNGYVVTNAHVLSGGHIIQAIDYEKNELPAQFIGYSEELDIALLKINGNYEKLELADSDKVKAGDSVIAIGNPLGLQFSVSEGIVSATHRQGPNGLEIYIQTDAALNQGNSGGPLINKNNKVIGINNFKIGSGESLGFALESNYIKSAVNNIAIQVMNQTLI